MDMAPIATESDAVTKASTNSESPLLPSQRERDDDERGAAGRDLAAGYGEHAAHGAGDADEDDGHRGCLEKGVLYALVDEPSEGEAGEAAQEDERDVDERSESDHGGS